MEKEIKHQIKENELVYNIYEIYVDWQIDHNIFPQIGIYDPHGINNFEDFLNSSRWLVAKVKINGSEKLILDIGLKHFNYCKETKLIKTVLEENISGK
ncbi:MAG TPA: hypothetical protein GXX46_12800 [Peptococcaceae bacterium]|nr:hypothetical protein [Peptococcaceae bacterium]